MKFRNRCHQSTNKYYDEVVIEGEKKKTSRKFNTYDDSSQAGQKSFAPSPMYTTLSYFFSFIILLISLPLHRFGAQDFFPVFELVVSQPCGASTPSLIYPSTHNRLSWSQYPRLVTTSVKRCCTLCCSKIRLMVYVLASLRIRRSAPAE